MESRGRRSFAFLLLVLAQALHSIEEYVTKLYDVFAPARLLSSLISDDLSFGFLIGNVVLVAVGLWCWMIPVRLRWRTAGAVTWFWSLLELANGINHSLLALGSGGYFPGVLTAPLLLALASWNVALLMRDR